MAKGVKMNTPQETYTFSRALHMMRYGGKKMRCVHWCEDVYAEVVGTSFRVWSEGKPDATPTLAPFEIMGEWVEVK